MKKYYLSILQTGQVKIQLFINLKDPNIKIRSDSIRLSILLNQKKKMRKNIW